MVIETGKNKYTNIDFCMLKQDTLEEAIDLYNQIYTRLYFHNPIGLELLLSTDMFTYKSGITITSIYSDVSSDIIKEHVLGIFN